MKNFVEMRDKVASPTFQTFRKVEHALERALPGRYVSRYEMVSFTTIPYAEVPPPALELPPRPKRTGYERPPREQATYVPDHCATLLDG